MLRNLMAGVLILASLAACATLSKPNPRAAARLQEANTALDSLSADSTAFYAKLEILRQDIWALYNHPGWSEMETVVAFTASRTEIEDDFSIDLDLQNALDAWTAKWGDSGEDLFLHYRSLVDLCSISEAHRIGLIGRLSSLQALYLEAVFVELLADRYAQAEAIFGTVEALSKAEEELNSYVLNAIGLYEVKPSR
jgi:hypothetical protein